MPRRKKHSPLVLGNIRRGTVSPVKPINSVEDAIKEFGQPSVQTSLMTMSTILDADGTPNSFILNPARIAALATQGQRFAIEAGVPYSPLWSVGRRLVDLDVIITKTMAFIDAYARGEALNTPETIVRYRAYSLLEYLLDDLFAGRQATHTLYLLPLIPLSEREHAWIISCIIYNTSSDQYTVRVDIATDREIKDNYLDTWSNSDVSEPDDRPLIDLSYTQHLSIINHLTNKDTTACLSGPPNIVNRT